jgi:hypothetical protein
MAVAGILKAPVFSLNRGFYDKPIDVTITTEVESAAIRYTLDGSLPSQLLMAESTQAPSPSKPQAPCKPWPFEKAGAQAR